LLGLTPFDSLGQTLLPDEPYPGETVVVFTHMMSVGHGLSEANDSRGTRRDEDGLAAVSAGRLDLRETPCWGLVGGVLRYSAITYQIRIKLSP